MYRPDRRTDPAAARLANPTVTPAEPLSWGDKLVGDAIRKKTTKKQTGPAKVSSSTSPPATEGKRFQFWPQGHPLHQEGRQQPAVEPMCSPPSPPSSPAAGGASRPLTAGSILCGVPLNSLARPFCGGNNRQLVMDRPKVSSWSPRPPSAAAASSVVDLTYSEDTSSSSSSRSGTYAGFSDHTLRVVREFREKNRPAKGRHTMLDIILRTNVTDNDATIVDVIGNGPTCMAPSLPAIPEIFVSPETDSSDMIVNWEGRRAYTEFFLPTLEPSYDTTYTPVPGIGLMSAEQNHANATATVGFRIL
ncbi:hypothetical protein AGDE_13758 [Angomonas deanei]|uniref:Uncharacterized protein n=1 Tax=Angomonas deanei TaxID=59799 RepID=A0A7G2CU43_9TRYP|nr:hypothetical protein AGDE_13758 [Angomonas deanei]CAD2221752.1 hypothetical protein, conserved [Angomonas deanei]|eukprot:EPY21840.1 hypothetical protein AGDE_13758 [Angomonas deanei]